MERCRLLEQNDRLLEATGPVGHEASLLEQGGPLVILARKLDRATQDALGCDAGKAPMVPAR